MKRSFLSTYADKRLKTLELANIYRNLSILHKEDILCDYFSKTHENLKNCGTMLSFAENLYDDSEKKLVSANFCRHRLCPSCSWRRSLKVFSTMMKYLEVINSPEKLQNAGLSEYSNCKFRFLFTTFTIRNCTARELKPTIDLLFKAYTQNLMRWKRVKNNVIGNYRALEVTYNKEKNTFHPHLHCVWVVPESYFHKKDRYISNNLLRFLWKKALGVDYLPQVDIRSIKASGDDIDSLASAICEVTKYTLKDSDYLGVYKDEDCQLFKECNLVHILDAALKGRRLYSFSGLFKKVANALDLDENDLTDYESIDRANCYIVKSYAWNVGFSRFDYVSGSSVSFDLWDSRKNYEKSAANFSKYASSSDYKVHLLHKDDIEVVRMRLDVKHKKILLDRAVREWESSGISSYLDTIETTCNSEKPSKPLILAENLKSRGCKCCT